MGRKSPVFFQPQRSIKSPMTWDVAFWGEIRPLGERRFRNNHDLIFL